MMSLGSYVLFTITTLSLLSIYESAFQLVSAEIMVQFVFNNGQSPSSMTSCSKTDIEKIDKIFNAIYRRNLRSTATTDEYPTSSRIETVPRELRTVPKYCKNYCANYAPGTCRTTKCLGYRRSLKASKATQLDNTCNESLTSINKQLDELISKNAVSSTCKIYLSNSARNTTCNDDVVHGEVEGYRIWNTTSTGSNGKKSPNVLFESKDMATGSGGYAFCQTTVFNIEVMTNECVDNAQMIVRGPNKYYSNRREGFIPFTIFTSSSTDNTDIQKGKIMLMGQKVPRIGTYIVTIIPDGISTKMKQFDFTILDC